MQSNPIQPILLHSTLRPHNTPSEELTYNSKPIPRARQLPLEQIMLIRGINLSLPDSAQSRIGRGADGTLRVVVEVVQTTLVERVSAEEVDCGQVEGSAAGLAAAGLEDYWLGG